jgi:ABC-type multidrug transport system fused ATPase/permease subunit
MSNTERTTYFFFVGLRCVVALFDLVGILAIGFLATSIALFVTLGSDSSRIIEFGGLAIPAVTAQTLPIVAGLILGLFLAKAVFSILLTRQLAFFLARVEARAARKVAERAFGTSLREARLYSREEIYFAIQTGSPSAFNAILNSAGTIAAESILFLLVLGAFFFLDPLSATGALVYFFGVALVIQLFIGNLMQRSAAKASEGALAANTAIGDLSEVFREASVLGKRTFFFDKIHDARTKSASSTATQLTLAGMPRYVVETALMVAVAIFVLYQSATGDLTKAAATLGVFLSGGLRLTASLLPLQSALLSIKQSIPMAERALELLDSEPGTNSKDFNSFVRSDSAPLGPLGVKFDGVTFAYPSSEAMAVNGVSFQVKPGQQVALIGPSGSGKSTIADLMLGLLYPTLGTAKVEDKDPKAIISWEPGRLAYVPQKPGIVSGTVIDNIALGIPSGEVDYDRLESALAAAHLTEVMKGLPEGVNTQLGKRKDSLSGGQLQRIGLARALYSKPGLLVMDEATSALDAESENEINKALDEMRGRVTVVLIAHRLNTVQRSDVVFLVEGGRVTASGTFPELLSSNKTVQKLAELMSIDPLDQ